MRLANEPVNFSTQLTQTKGYSETQFLLTHVSLFYELRYLLWHGPISDTTLSVPKVHYCLTCHLCHAWQKV